MNKTNQWAQTKCRFPNVPFAKHTLFYMQMQVFLFSFFNVMNAKKKLGALNQQFKCLLLSRNEEYKQQFLFWRKNEEFNNNFSYQEMKNLRQFPISKANGSNAKINILWDKLANDKEKCFKKTLNKISFKGGRSR